MAYGLPPRLDGSTSLRLFALVIVHGRFVASAIVSAAKTRRPRRLHTASHCSLMLQSVFGCDHQIFLVPVQNHPFRASPEFHKARRAREVTPTKRRREPKVAREVASRFTALVPVQGPDQ
jgi:hypothetical protein